MAANEFGGTARSALSSNGGEFILAAKTGTAQTADFGKKSHNALVVAFGPFEDPRYAVVAVVQAGKSGGGVAGPVVKRMFSCLQAWELGALPKAEYLEDYPGHIAYVNKVKIPIEGTPHEKFLMPSTEDLSPQDASSETNTND